MFFRRMWSHYEKTRVTAKSSENSSPRGAVARGAGRAAADAQVRRSAPSTRTVHHFCENFRDKETVLSKCPFLDKGK